jgi:hypothetical protein
LWLITLLSLAVAVVDSGLLAQVERVVYAQL